MKPNHSSERNESGVARVESRRFCRRLLPKSKQKTNIKNRTRNGGTLGSWIEEDCSKLWNRSDLRAQV